MLTWELSSWLQVGLGFTVYGSGLGWTCEPSSWLHLSQYMGMKDHKVSSQWDMYFSVTRQKQMWTNFYSGRDKLTHAFVTSKI
jgi:hypothetical protein